jgi:hypothetical protein
LVSGRTSEAPASCRSAGQDRRPYGTAPPSAKASRQSCGSILLPLVVWFLSCVALCPHMERQTQLSGLALADWAGAGIPIAEGQNARPQVAHARHCTGPRTDDLGGPRRLVLTIAVNRFTAPTVPEQYRLKAAMAISSKLRSARVVSRPNVQREPFRL